MTKRGESFTYKTFAEGSRDGYEDIAYTASSGVAIQGIRTAASGAVVRSVQPDGEVRRVDIDVLVASVTTISEEMGTDRAPTLTDATGLIYRILGVSRVGAPGDSKRIFCEQVFV